MSWFSRLRNSIQRGRISRELDEEMQFHIEQRAANLGLTPDEVRRRFGNQLRLREESRDVKAAAWPESLSLDFRFGVRMLRKNPLVTTAALLSLSLAIGSCTAVFSLVDALVLRPLPLPDPDSLVYLSYTDLDRTTEIETFPYPLFERMREEAKPYADLFGIGPQVQRPTRINTTSEAETVRVQFVSGDSFSILGVRAVLGRLLAPSDDLQPPAVAVLSHAFWARRFGKDPGVLGRWIRVEDQDAQIVGVAAERYTGTDVGISTDVWMPNMTWHGTRDFTARGYSWMRIWARRKLGVRSKRVRDVLQAAFSNHRRERSAEMRTEESPAIVDQFRSTRLEVRPAAVGVSALRKEFARPLWILGTLVGLVLVIACANVANLLLARASSRAREMAIRLAVGASRRRLVRQLMLESSLLALLSSGLGIMLAVWSTPLIIHLMAPSTAPASLSLRPDWRVMGFLAGLSVAATLLFGLAPSLRASSARPASAMRSGDSRVVQLGLNRVLVAAQIGFCLMVLFVSGLFMLSFRSVLTREMGFRKDGLVLVNLLAVEFQKQPAAAPAYWEQARQTIRGIPGVTGVSFSTWPVMGPLLSESGATGAARVDGTPSHGEGVYFSAVSPEFFETMGVSILSGRGFEPRDAAREPATVAVVNESFARKYFRGENPVGRTLEHYATRDRLERFEVVGVANDTKFRATGDAAWPTVWTPLRPIDYVKMEIRTSVDAGAVRQILRQELPRIHSAFQIFSVTTAATILDDKTIRDRLLATLSGFFALLATILAAVGIYGVLNYSVARRTNEIGLRMALGADAGEVIRLIVREVLWIAAAGLILGLAGSYVIQRFIQALLYGIRPSDPAAVAGPIALLVAVVIIAAVPPALRASRVDPLTALRYE